MRRIVRGRAEKESLDSSVTRLGIDGAAAHHVVSDPDFPTPVESVRNRLFQSHGTWLSLLSCPLPLLRSRCLIATPHPPNA